MAIPLQRRAHQAGYTFSHSQSAVEPFLARAEFPQACYWLATDGQPRFRRIEWLRRGAQNTGGDWTRDFEPPDDLSIFKLLHPLIALGVMAASATWLVWTLVHSGTGLMPQWTDLSPTEVNQVLIGRR
ncbi:hypothetical protein FYK55_16840 [Roseiconus nitratireducens]|uniref:Uncharacterized protein n=1 Tax=Roseiconus nitratireducens TaxID=2605748 RepID=A0A5M6D2Z6_9BACT|nr:hypothetical protein [Roseiconus nitratireducens]KAA5541868.1 hypothetical protein FYK55_16840 [Roseiconus nitratireducens]